MAARIVLAVRESQYIEPVLQYVHHSEYGDMLRISAFSKMAAFVEFMKGDEIPDAVVGDASFIEAWLVEGRTTVPWAVLSEDVGYSGKSIGGLAGGVMIAKYQALPSLLESMLQLCEISRVRTASSVKEETLVLGVVSCSGSNGKTTIALNLAKQLGGIGLSVFYLNLESVDSSGLFLRPPTGNAPGLERLLYEIQASRGKEADEVDLGRYVLRHEALLSDAFRPVGNVKEMLQMTKRDTLDLLERLAAGGYDVVIVDTGSLEEERAEAVLQRCGMLLWVLKHDDISLHKTVRWLSHCTAPHSGMPANLLDKSRFVVNLATNSMEGRLPPEGITFDCILPFIPSWALQHREELCLNSPQFQREILEFCKAFIEPALPLVFTGKGQYE
ncbi:hypothetical protein [Paenibacillus monticola]|uniref:CobQ/CobB/MinD/ParA nucleotide binding domain-containing protein n=1 Tax=Paenibacillus monticola TaxID=2666075 RepID=A0A7X2L061_9BACL|nr:hypothetical protein [Paenibacillus monticola]MRN51788.1 hypothetical protein [Paenibacillus monticola]